jgi:hypothetical protein
MNIAYYNLIARTSDDSSDDLDLFFWMLWVQQDHKEEK